MHDRAPFTKGEKPAFHTPLDNFVKLRLWQLPYRRVVFLDADTLVLRNIDRLFDYPEFSAAPNVYESLADFRRLNSGVFTARPDPATFAAMLARLDAPGAVWRRTDQTFLETFFPRWQGLPVYDNLLQYVWFNLPDLWDWCLDQRPALPVRKALGPGQSQGRPPRAPDRPLASLPRRRPDPRSRRPARPVRVLLTGGSGYVGGFVAPALAAAGHVVTHLARRPPAGGSAWLPFDLAAPPPRLPVADALVHLAFDHAPGRYRGGEGDDPDGFLRRNRDGSLALIEAAGVAGARVIFLSSRAVYGDGRGGETLRETDPLAPDSLYGEMKFEVEAAVFAHGGAALRATGVYGRPAGAATHKWSELFADYLAGHPVTPRVATEIHGDDLATAVLALLAAPDPAGPWNASDILLDRSDLLAAVAARTGCTRPPPPRAPSPPPGVMATERLHGLGWRPGGLDRLDAFIRDEFPT